jgi:hypothetical protein
VQLALQALSNESPPLFNAQPLVGDDEIKAVGEPTGEARRRAGTWPSAQSITDELVRALETAAEHEPNPEKKSKLRTMAETADGIAREVVADVAAKVITGQLG